MVGETAPVRAWSCPAGETPPFGEDKDPGTADDTCRDVEAEWSINDAGLAELGKDDAAKTRVTALAITGATKIIAEHGDQVARADLVIAPAPDPEPTPEADAHNPATENDRAHEDAADDRADQDTAPPDEPKIHGPESNDSAPDGSEAIEAEAAPPSQAPGAEGVSAPEPDASVVPVDEALTEEPSVEALESRVPTRPVHPRQSRLMPQRSSPCQRSLALTATVSLARCRRTWSRLRPPSTSTETACWTTW